MSSSSGISIKGEGHDHSSSSKSSAPSVGGGGVVRAGSFEERASLFGLSEEICAEVNRENLSPQGAGTIVLRPLCVVGGGGESLDIRVGCDDFAGDISISPNMEMGTIESQCSGSARSKVNGYTVEIKVPLYLDKLLANKPLLKAMYRSEALARSVAADGKEYELYGVGNDIFKGVLPRFYCEVVPSEISGASMTGLVFPYCEMQPIGGSLSFGKTANRTTELTLMASMPPGVSIGGIAPFVSGIWRQV